MSFAPGLPDTPEIGREMADRVDRARARDRLNPIVWIPEIVPKDPRSSRFTPTPSLFACPSVYEPFGIINLEAMACGTPVVASAVGGIIEVVVPGRTGLLVPVDAARRGRLRAQVDPAKFARDFAEAINRLLDDPDRLKEMGARSRERVEHFFSWTSIARWTMDFYWDLVQA